MEVAEKKPCELLAVLVADRVFREEGNLKVHVTGIFNELKAPAFPCLHPSMHLYVALTDVVPGQHTGKVRFVYEDASQTELMSVEGPFVTADRLQVNELNIGFGPLLFPKEGVLSIEFCMDGEYVGRRKIRLATLPKPA